MVTRTRWEEMNFQAKSDDSSQTVPLCTPRLSGHVSSLLLEDLSVCPHCVFPPQDGGKKKPKKTFGSMNEGLNAVNELRHLHSLNPRKSGFNKQWCNGQNKVL